MPKTNKNQKINKNNINIKSLIQSLKDSDKSHNKPPDGATFTLETPMPRTVLTNPNDNRFTCVQTVMSPAFFTTSGSVPTFTAITVSFSQVDQYVSLTNVFDQYRIMEVEIWLIPQISASVSSSHVGEYFTVLDYDDSANLTSIGQAQDYESCISSPVTYGHYRRFTPHAASALYTSTFTGYGNVTSPWIDTASSNVSHYGVKVASAITSAASTFDLKIRMKLQFKNVR
jgi:hypothetical protein